MRQSEVTVGETYLARVSGEIVPVKVTRQSYRHGSGRYGGGLRAAWEAVNQVTGRSITIRSAQRLRPMPSQDILNRAANARVRESIRRMDSTRNALPLPSSPDPDAQGGEAEPQAESTGPVRATVTINDAKGGVEIRFTAMPALAVRNDLKDYGFRWSRFSRCWWARQDGGIVEAVRSLLGHYGLLGEPSATPKSEPTPPADPPVAEAVAEPATVAQGWIITDWLGRTVAGEAAVRAAVEAKGC